MGTKNDTQQIPRQTTQQLPKTVVVRQGRRAGLAVAGGVLIALGVALVWLPGPFSLPLIALGLLVLSREFRWAKRLLLRVRPLMARAIPRKGRRKAG